MTAPTAMLKTFLDKPPPAYLDCLFNLVSAEDVARAHILAAQKPVGGRYILGGDTIEMSQLVKMIGQHTDKTMPKHAVPYALAALTAYISLFIARFTGKAPLASLEGVRLAKHKTLIDSSYAHNKLDWNPKPIETALEECVNWLNNQ